MATPPRGRADYLRLGDWNAQCSMCGGKFKAGEMVRNWQGMWRCQRCNEPRQPQDFVRAPQDNPAPPWIQPFKSIYAGVCSPNSMTAIACEAVAGCAIAGYISPAFDPCINNGIIPVGSAAEAALLECECCCTAEGISGIAGFAVAGCAVPGVATIYNPLLCC